LLFPATQGLNLQHASTLINMDLPWNPAVLEQRISRIHRMGQKRPVQIVNYVSKGTIEEGMLSVLAFKRSLSAGILDGGSGEIVLGGSRLSRFMKDVERVTGRMGEGEATAPAEEAVNVAAALEEPLAETPPLLLGVAAAASGPAAADAQDLPPPTDAHDLPPPTGGQDGPPPAQPDPWSGLLKVGADLLSVLTSPDAGTAPAHPWVERDPVSGARHLKVPMPSPQTAGRLADALAAGMRFRDRQAIRLHPFNMKLHRFVDEIRHLSPRFANRNTTRKVGHIRAKARWTFFNHDEILHALPHFFKPACLRMLFSVPEGTSTLPLPETVTVPGYDA